MWRAVDVFRPIAWLYAVYSAFVRQEDFARPWLGWVVLGVLGAWTLGMVLYRTRTTRVVAFELVLACAAILSTRLLDTSEVIVGGAKTLPGFWPAAAVVAWAVLKGWRGGMVAAAVVGFVDLLEVGVATENTVTNIVILVLLGGCIGYCADLSRDGHAALRESLRGPGGGARARSAGTHRPRRRAADPVLHSSPRARHRWRVARARVHGR
jgi:hypothetical protein